MERRRNRLLSYFSRDRERSLVTQPSVSSPPSTQVSSTSLTSVVRSPDPLGSARANPALEIAIKKHLEELPEAEKDAFQEASKAMTQDNLLSTLRAYDEDHKQNSSFRPRAENLSKLFNLLNRFMAGVSTAIQANPLPAAIIVGAVQVVIGLAVEFTTFFDRLTDMLCRFIDYLGPLAEYAKASMDSELIQRTLATAYGDLLKFCRDARHVFIDEKGVQRRWTSVITFLRVQWEPFASTFGDTESKFRHHVNVLDQSAQALQLNQMREAERLRAGWFLVGAKQTDALIRS
jgi:ankyrin repeat domain-containing protein 50